MMQSGKALRLTVFAGLLRSYSGRGKVEPNFPAQLRAPRRAIQEDAFRCVQRKEMYPCPR